MRVRWRTVLYGVVTVYISVYWVRYGVGIERTKGLWEQSGIPLCVSGPITADSSTCHAFFVPSHGVHDLLLLGFFSREPSMPLQVLQEMTTIPLTVTIADPGGEVLWERSYNQAGRDPTAPWGVHLRLPDGCITRPVIPEGYGNWAQEGPDGSVEVPALRMRSFHPGNWQRLELTLDFPAGLPKELPGPVYAAAVAVDELSRVRVLLYRVAFLAASFFLLIGVVVTFRSVFAVRVRNRDASVTADEAQPEP